MQRKPVLIAFILLMLTCGLPLAAQANTPSLSLNGFGTLGVVHSDEDQADFVSSMLMPRGAGHTSDWSAEVDSRLGLQLTANLTPRLSSVVQIVTEQQYDGQFRPAIEWANINFDVTPELSLRVGRVILPVFMNSEYRKVGYATPWVRPPLEVYRTIPVSSIDGLDVSYRSRIASATSTLRATYGQSDTTFPYIDNTGNRATAEARAREGLTISNVVEQGNLSVFAAYSHYRLSIEDFNPLFDVFRMFGPEGDAIADRYNVDDKSFEVISLGARYDPGNWFVMGEWAQTSSRTFLADNRGWYISGGYRLGAFTPYLTYANQRIHSQTSTPGLSQPGSEALDAMLNSLLQGQPQQKSISLGLRWDFSSSMAIKAQFDHMNHEGGSRGYLVNSQPGFDPGGSVNLFSLALDFVF
ncbi:porin [Billgrantia antri]|uniref:Porin n=1 Tax=Halomonas sulfidivorans TaxID=2733488 RepID=A0ABX7WLZ3_9GAMM|nr:porin [Halomonas sulfidivorans]QTP60517.1 porin [Halomonas sulfidivorans]